MFQLQLVGSAISRTQGPLWSPAYYEDHGVASRLKVARARADIHCSHASSEDRAHHQAGHDVLFCLKERLNDSVHVRAARHAAGHLRNNEPRKLELRMMRTKLRKHFRNLLRRGDATICYKTPMQGFRVIEVDYSFREVGAVVRDQVEMRVVRRTVVFTDQGIVLVRSSSDLEAVDSAIIRRSDELVPVPARGFAILYVRRDIFQIFAAIAVAQECGH